MFHCCVWLPEGVESSYNVNEWGLFGIIWDFDIMNIWSQIYSMDIHIYIYVLNLIL